MERQFDRTLFDRVFSDAHVVDIDLSNWDKQISIWALADHFEDWHDRRPLVVVDFIAVHGLSCRWPMIADNMYESVDHHLQWAIDDADVNATLGLFEVVLRGSRSTPVLVIHCESIEIRKANVSFLDHLFPGWNRPFAALARPNIDVLSRLLPTKGKADPG